MIKVRDATSLRDYRPNHASNTDVARSKHRRWRSRTGLQPLLRLPPQTRRGRSGLRQRRGDPPLKRLLLRGVGLSLRRSLGASPVNRSSPSAKSALKNCLRDLSRQCPDWFPNSAPKEGPTVANSPML